MPNDTINQRENCILQRGSSVLFLLLLIFIAAGTPGCLKLVQQQSGDEHSPGSEPLPTRQSSGPGNTSPAFSATLSPSISQASLSPGVVSDALPELTPDPYPVQHATRINTTAEPSLHVRSADFKKTYVLRGNATGLIINATVLKGPLWISFDVEPLYDCLNPESCRGNLAKSVSRPYFTLTVRNNQTREIVAEDGYGREYSMQKTNRTIKIYGEGWYHLTLTGNSVDILLSVSTGTAPAISAVQAPGTSPSPSTTLPPELLRRIYQGG